MKRLNLLVSLLLVCPLMMFGQLKVQSDGVFKANNTLAGMMGNQNSNVSYGIGTLGAFGGPLTGSGNTATGYYALRSVMSGSGNTANGYQALYYNQTGSGNTAVGSSALFGEMYASGSYNTAVGNRALQYYSLGSYNTAVGSYALYDPSSLVKNGYNTLDSDMTGSYNTAVGYYAGSLYYSFSNSTAIGYNATNTASNQVVLGNTSVTSIGGSVNWGIISDGRVKKNIRAEVPGLAFINLLQPVTYNLDLAAVDEIQKSDDQKINHFNDSLRIAASPEEKEILAKARANKEKQVYSGFIAQDVEKAAQSVGYDFSGVSAPENDKGTYGLRYAEFVVPLVKAVQELSEQNDAKDAAIALLQEQVNQLNARLDELMSAPKRPDAGGIDGSAGANNFSFTIFPNPTNGFVTINYTLFVDVPVCIELYNMYGQRMKLIVPQQNQKAGTYSVQTAVADLGAGTYIVKATSGGQVEGKQLVIN